jgi:hypothetical protein
VNFYLFPGSFPILDHQRELEVVILQNFRWDNARYGLKPTYMYPDKFEYRFEAANDFEGGNEYRLIDCRNIRQQGLGVSRFHYDDSVTTVELLPERIRTSNTYRADPDLNGNFFTGIRGMPGAGAADVDYVNVRFSLEMAEPLVDSVFIFGALSDWRLDPRFLMRWNRGYYTADVLLKQGVYNYHYVVAENGKPDETRLEGSHFETENYYTILVYYKGPIDRTHRLIGFRHLNYYD